MKVVLDISGMMTTMMMMMDDSDDVSYQRWRWLGVQEQREMIGPYLLIFSNY